MRTLKMRNLLSKHRRGVLTFEWMLLFALLVIGIIGGIAMMRDVISFRLIDAGKALGALDMSYDVPAVVEYKAADSTVKTVAPAQTNESTQMNTTIAVSKLNTETASN